MVLQLPLILAGCAIQPRLEAVPEGAQTRATLPGMPRVRYWIGSDLTPLREDAISALAREMAHRKKLNLGGDVPAASYLAISGGGDKGAFAAGLLYGWTKTGNRPQFKVVTGVSTGALIAPFAFLGTDYDEMLKELYTTISPEKIYKPRRFWAALLDDAISDNRPMWETLRPFVNEKLMDAIAKEYAKGRFLLIGTVNLDLQRPVIWNMGAIASSKAPGALDLFLKIMLASAAIPGVFPPVMIDVEVDGKAYQEMHVDGGVAAQVFLYPPNLTTGHVVTKRKHTAYIIRNSRLDPGWATVDLRAIDIAGRAISSLIHHQGLGDLYRIYLTAKKDGLDYNLAYITKDFKATHKETFDTKYMNELFNFGRKLGEKGYSWKKSPPYYSDVSLSEKNSP